MSYRNLYSHKMWQSLLTKSLITDVNECTGVTCQNGGSCVDGDNSFTCVCQPGYEVLFFYNKNFAITICFYYCNFSQFSLTSVTPADCFFFSKQFWGDILQTLEFNWLQWAKNSIFLKHRIVGNLISMRIVILKILLKILYSIHAFKRIGVPKN